MLKLEKISQEIGLTCIEKTTVWDIHNSDHLSNLARKKGTNLYKVFKKLYENGERGGFTLVVGRVGRTQHSATEIGIFKGTIDFKNYDEVFINEPNSKYWI